MKIALIGVGQQGTSQAFAFSKLDRVEEIRVYDIKPDIEVQIRAKAEEASVDISKLVFCSSAEEAIEGADVIGINTPMSEFEAVAAEVAQHARKNAILYDNGSGKVQAINDVTAGLGENENSIHYFPAHFFVGQAGSGPAFAKPDMYKKQTAAMMDLREPSARTQVSDLAKITMSDLLRDTGLKNLRTDLSAQDHDESLGFYSHHNTFAVTALMLAFPQVEINGNPVQVGRFLSSTRVAAHGADGATFWAPIANDNSVAIVSAANNFSSQLHRIRRALQTKELGGGVGELRAAFMDADIYVSDIDLDRTFEQLDGDVSDLGALAVDGADFEKYAASHVAMPMVFAVASALAGYSYEGADGQPFSSIGNSSFQDSIRPSRADFNAAVKFIWERREAVLAAVETLQAKHDEITEAIAANNGDAVVGFIHESHGIRSQLPEHPEAARPEYVAS